MDNFDPVEVEFLINNEQVKRDAKKVRDEITGIGKTADEAGQRVGATVIPPIQGVGNAAEVAAQKVAVLARRTNTLNFSVAQLTRELPAFAFSAQTGFLALSNNIPIFTDQIGLLRAENAKLTASGGKAVPVWKSLLGSLKTFPVIIGFLVTAFTLFGPKIVNFISRLFDGKAAIDAQKQAVEALNKAYESKEVEGAIKKVLELKASFDLARKGVEDKDKVLKEYNDKLGDTFGKATDVNDAERTFTQKSDAYVQAMLFRAAAAQALSDTSKQLVKNMQDQQKVEDEIIAAQEAERKALAKPTDLSRAAQGQFINLPASTAVFNQKVADESLNDLKKEADKIEQTGEQIIQKFREQAARIAKAAGLNLDGGNNKGHDKILQARRSLLERIAALDEEFSRKQLTRDDEELQALRDKFDRVRKLVKDFNADPKNSKVKIGLSDLDALQNDAEQTLIFRQQTKSLERELNDQTKLFTDFEEFKKQFGIDKAKESFSEQLKGFETFSDLLKSKVEDNQAAFDAVAAGTATGAQTERVTLLNKQSEEEKKVQSKKFNDMLADLLTFEQKRNLLIQQFTDQRNQLLAAGNVAAAGELERKFKEELANLDDSFVKNTSEFKALIAGIEGLSRTAAQAVIDNARRMVASLLEAGRISEETAAEITKKIDDLQKTVDDSVGSKFNEIASKIGQLADAFANLGDAVEFFDEGLASTITTISELGKVAADVAGSVASFASGDIVGGIAQGVNAIAGILRIASKARESARKARQELLRLQQEVEDGERRLNELQRQRTFDKAREIELTIKGLAAQREALKLAEQQNKADQDSLLNELQGLQFVKSSKTKKIGGFLGIGRKTVVVKEFADLLGLTFEEIERLFEQGKLEGRAKDLFEQLRNLKEEGVDIQAALDDLQATANEIFTGTTSDSIADTIIEGLRQGKSSFEDFAGDVESLLQGAILNAIKFQTLEEPLKNLFKEFANFAESGGELTTEEADKLRAGFKTTIDKAVSQFEALNGIIDQDLLGGAGPQGLQGAIRRELTEATASELTGLFRGQFDVTKRHFQLDEQRFEVDKRNLDATLQLMQTSTFIEANTANTVLQLQQAVSELKIISRNTKPGQTGRDLGLGG